MLVSAGLCPHSPTLIPYIGKENLNSAKSTIKSLETLFSEILSSQISALILLYTPKDGNRISKKIKINVEAEVEVNLEEFGDLEHKFTFSSDIGLGHRLKEIVETAMPVDLVSNHIEDYSLNVPVYYINKMQKNGFKILPISISAGFKKEFLTMFGRYLKEKLVSLNERYSVLAVGDLSHALSEDSPSGFRKAGVLFDNQFVAGLRNKKLNESLNIGSKTINMAEQCIFDPFCVLAGILHGMEFETKALSYEHPFGVGFLVAQFCIS